MRNHIARKRARRQVGVCALLLTWALLIGRVVGQSPGNLPLITITSPQTNHTYSDAGVRISVHLRSDAIPSSFRAQANGDDVTSLFQQTAPCQGSVCDLQAYLPERDFLHGTNALTVEVEGEGQIAADDRVQFEYQSPLVQNDPVAKLTPSVAVWSVKHDQGGPVDDYKSYDIIVGPGPDFPQRIYSGADLQCEAGINSVQVLVLQRKTLSPEADKGRGCFSNSGSLATFLKSVPKNDLVILNNFLGHMQNIDTTAIGGTNYAGQNINTLYYNAIGVAGAASGTAYESYQPNLSHTPREKFLPPLVGSLVLDTANNYFFAPKDFPELKVTPGTGGDCSTISVNGHGFRQCLPNNSKGAFWIIAMDRLSGEVTDHYLLITNSNDPNERKLAISDLAYLLRGYYKSNDLLAISTVGTPIHSNTEVTRDLWDSVMRLGGNGFILPQLTSDGATYTLVSSNDPAYVYTARLARESTSIRPKETGELDLVLGRNKRNQFGLYQDYPGDFLTSFSGNAWPSTVFQQPQDWPAWTSGQAKAYEDLTSSSNHYPTLRAALGCSVGSCQQVRRYYSSTMATCVAPSSVAPVITALPFSSGHGYTEEEFRAVKDQLVIEIGYVDQVSKLCGFMRQLTDQQGSTLQKALINVGTTINSSLEKKAKDAQIRVDELTKYSSLVAIGSHIPYLGSAFSAVSTFLNASAQLSSVNASIPGDFTYTLAQLQNTNDDVFGTRLSLLTTNVFTAISDDWGKLQVIGGGFGQQKAPWFFCANCSNAGLPLTALPAIALGAKRDYYKTLLPTAYDLDIFTEQTNPDIKYYRRDVAIFGGRICIYPYGNFPQGSYWNYHALMKPSTFDITILNEKGRNGNHAIPPTSELVSDLLDAPVIDPTGYTLRGGAGLIHDDFIKAGSDFTARAGYAPGITCTRP